MTRYKIAITNFYLYNKYKKDRFLKKNFLLTNNSMKIV